MEEETLFVGLLQAGSLQSFTDLFYLHRRELSAGEAPEALSVLSGIAASLAEGEAARASGDTSKLLTSLQAIGARYSASGTHGSAIMFYARALDLARSSSDTAAELHCLGELGRCEEHRGGLPAACAHHEARRALAAARGNAEALASAAADLMGVRKREAEAAEARSDLQGSLSALELALAAAKQAGNAEGEAHLSYSVGRALILSGDAQGALPHLTNFHQVVSATPALQLQQTRALASLSAAHNLVGNAAQAVASLEELVEVAKRGGAALDGAQAEACENLGILAAQSGDSARATHFLEASYALRQDIVRRGGEGCSRGDLQRSRLFVGLSRAQSLSSEFLKACITNDIHSLFSFKDGKKGSL